MLELVVLIGVVCKFKHTCLNRLGFVGGPMALGTPQCCLRMKLEREREREREFKHHLSSQEVMHAYVWVWGGGRAGALVESLREI